MQKGVLTQKTFKNLSSENEKLGLLGNQMGQMRSDFDELKKAREIAKKNLEQQFQDIYEQYIYKSKIDNIKSFVKDEGVRINNVMIAFQNKFEKDLKEIKNHFQQICDESQSYNTEQFNQLNKTCNTLESKIDQEREDRIEQHNQDLSNINDLFTLYETEKSERIEGNKNCLKILGVEAIRLKELLEKEIAQRKQRNEELIEHTNYEITKQKEFNDDFNKKALEEFHFIVRNIQNEMDNRFDHQNQIVANLTNIVKTIQETLKVIGKDV